MAAGGGPVDEAEMFQLKAVREPAVNLELTPGVPANY